VIKGIEAAKARGMFVIGLTGRDGGTVAPMCDLAFVIREPETSLIQEMHLTIMHVICALLDEMFD
jgi:D-sedoheptulose 7-phosphate isomerase